MYDYKREDQRLFLKELTHPMVAMALVVCTVGFFMGLGVAGGGFKPQISLVMLGVVGGLLRYAFTQAGLKRFRSKRFESVWKGILDRTGRFNEVLKKFRGENLGQLKEMESNIFKTQEILYAALRRADYITGEFHQTEANAPVAVWDAKTKDAQSTELYKIADKNIAEYRSQVTALTASVERTEAQSAVFMTTVDALRIKMLNHRLAGLGAIDNREFLGMLADARIQLDTIDKAIEEINLSAYPLDLPPPVPTDAAVHLSQGQE